MKEKFKIFGATLLLLILIPYMITVFFHDEAAGFFQRNDSSTELEEKVILLVSEEISGQAEIEAIKAQAVIARTQLYQNPGMEVSGNEINLQENMETIQFCAEETEGEILTCQGKPIDAAYHAVSGKVTRNAQEVMGQEEKVYLISVDSSVDIASPQYLTIFHMEKEQLAEKLKSLLPEIEIKPDTILTDIVIDERDSAGYVTKVRYGSSVLNGEAVRDALNLSSAVFYFSELDGKVRIMTKGLGHGLGLSQYGAQQMAIEGKKYQEILKYYYTGVEIEKI